MKILSFITILLFLSYISSNDIVYKCRTSDTEGEVEIGDEVALCLHVPELGKKVVFKLKVDEHTVISIENGFNKIALPNESGSSKMRLLVEPDSSEQPSNETRTETHILGQIGNVKTKYPTTYYLKINSESKIFSLFNMVIKVKKGKIYDIVWDNACYDCIDSCVKDLKSYALNEKNETISMTYQNCYGPEVSECLTSSTQCDPKFYITWFGTDKNGNQLKTTNLAMSKFRQYSISSLYSSVKDLMVK